MKNKTNFVDILQCCSPDAYANINGLNQCPRLYGKAHFYNVNCYGTLVELEVFNLPSASSEFKSSFYGLHIHENGNCTPPFDQTGNHYNPYNAPHPMHVGDMPALLGNNGYAYSVFYTQRFIVNDIIGRSIVIHLHPDDYMSQPSGNSGNKIGCGLICEFL